MSATSVVKIKAGRVGGYLEAVRIHDLCWDAGVPIVFSRPLERLAGGAPMSEPPPTVES
ncbi:hypothetical protein [Microbacterium luticocti]|uniref:hypothetical protein n=1 Tax=Microbacterium luticocti TaxID=451764 RepID=UPI003CCC3B37